MSHVTDISLTRNFRLARQAYIANQGEYYPPVGSIHDFPRLKMSDDNQGIETVLAVDSDEDNLCLLRSILGLKGLDVLTAVNGQEAVDLAVRWRPELILIDLKLPISLPLAALLNIRVRNPLLPPSWRRATGLTRNH